VASEALFTADSQTAEHRADTTPPGARLTRPAEDSRIVIPPTALLAPADGPTIHRFGEPLTGGGRASGITIATAKGARVAAPDSGIVQYVGPVKGWGVILILRLPGGYHLVLAGLDRANVGVGQSVAAGAPVGWMTDGKQSPSELYLEVRERGAPVDPARWLKNNQAG
jgi:septal ring factor EnvC (AmiA/AmiB activator)